MLTRGIALFEAGELMEATRCFEAAVLQEPNNAEAWRWLGQASSQSEKDTQVRVNSHTPTRRFDSI